ncbi:hypothetical protein D9M69_619470 [compost metagenome]
MQHDFRLDARLDVAVQPAADLAAVFQDDRMRIDPAPDREVHTQRRPHRGIGEPDLAADRPRAFRQPRLVDARGHLIGRVQAETRVSRGDRGNGSGVILRRLDIAGERCGGGSGHGGSWEGTQM